LIADCALIVMAKQPQPGRTKTRLCPSLTPQEAALLYEALLLDTLTLAVSIPGVQLAAAITPPDSEPYFKRIAPHGTLLIPIQGADIGECLSLALSELLQRGFRRVIALNADGPSLPPAYLQQAVHLLHDHDVVLGPGEDGGYYLIGLKRAEPQLFKGISWSTGQVLEQTIMQAHQLSLRTALTPPWYDVDLPADVLRLRCELEHLPVDRLLYTRSFFNRQAVGASFE
jgi:uncharacterized protein